MTLKDLIDEVDWCCDNIKHYANNVTEPKTISITAMHRTTIYAFMFYGNNKRYNLIFDTSGAIEKKISGDTSGLYNSCVTKISDITDFRSLVITISDWADIDTNKIDVYLENSYNHVLPITNVIQHITCSKDGYHSFVIEFK